MTDRSGGDVLIVVENLPVPFDRRVWMEATTLRRAGFGVSVICPTGKGHESRYEEIDGIHIYRHPLPPEHSSVCGYVREYAWALWHEWRLARRVRRDHGFRVIHACNPPDLIFLVALWFKTVGGGCRFLFDHHDLCPELFESKFGRRGPAHRLLRLMERCTFFLADRSIATNESYRDVAIRRDGMPPQRVSVVRSGPDLSKFQAVPSDPDRKHGRRFLVGYLGVMGEFDGVHHLVLAAWWLIKRLDRDDVTFLFIGDGPDRPRLMALAKSIGIADACDFPGRVDDDEMIAGLSSCDVCVDPDPYNPLNDRSTMNKILEYMALGKPVVQYDLTEGRRSAGPASRYARRNDPRDLAVKIAGLLDDGATCASLGEVGRSRMRDQLEWRHQRPKLVASYARLLRNPGIRR